MDLKGGVVPEGAGGDNRILVCIDEVHTPEAKATVRFAAQRARDGELNETLSLV